MASLLGIMQDSIEYDKAVAEFDHQTMQANGNFFALTQMIVEMDKMPEHKETITIKTRPAGTARLFPLRIYEIYDENQLIGKAKSIWAIIDIERRRPLRPEKAYPDTNWGEAEFAVPSRLKPAKDLKKVDEFVVKYSDIDPNEHVNNVRYITWLENALGRTPLKVTVNYVAELKLNDKVEVYKNDSQVLFKSGDKNIFIAEFDNMS